MRWNLLFLIFDFIIIPLPLWIDIFCPIFAAIYGLFVGWLGAFLLTVCAVRSLQANFLMKRVVPGDFWCATFFFLLRVFWLVLEGYTTLNSNPYIYIHMRIYIYSKNEFTIYIYNYVINMYILCEKPNTKHAILIHFGMFYRTRLWWFRGWFMDVYGIGFTTLYGVCKFY